MTPLERTVTALALGCIAAAAALLIRVMITTLRTQRQIERTGQQEREYKEETEQLRQQIAQLKKENPAATKLFREQLHVELPRPARIRQATQRAEKSLQSRNKKSDAVGKKCAKLRVSMREVKQNGVAAQKAEHAAQAELDELKRSLEQELLAAKQAWALKLERIRQQAESTLCELTETEEGLLHQLQAPRGALQALVARCSALKETVYALRTESYAREQAAVPCPELRIPGDPDLFFPCSENALSEMQPAASRLWALRTTQDHDLAERYGQKQLRYQLKRFHTLTEDEQMRVAQEIGACIQAGHPLRAIQLELWGLELRVRELLSGQYGRLA